MRPTRRGIAVLVCAVLLYLAGLLLGLPLLRALGGCALGAFLVAVAPVLSRLKPAVSRRVHPDRVQRGGTAFAELVVGNEGSFRQAAFVARDTIGDEVREIPVRALPAGGSARYRYEVPTNRRGRIPLGPLSIERSDLLGLARARGELGEVAELRVYPKRHPVRLSPAGRARHHHEGEPQLQPMRGSMDLRSLREYVVGDERRHLHWKATARTGQLMVREYVDPAQPWMVVLLDTRSAALSAERFEEAVEVATSLLWEACEQERPSRFCTTSGLRHDVVGGAKGVREILDLLCDVRQDDRVEITLDLTRLGAGRGDGLLAYIGGSGEELRVPGRRFARAVAFDLSVTAPSRDTDGLLAVRAPSAADALDTWNAVVAR
jgi:uncharacterized protein (DUF58 family)